jgi:alpha-L-rhamnosidase
MMFYRMFVLLSAVVLCVAEQQSPGPLPPADLRVEYLTNPSGIDIRQPRFSWVLHHTERGQKQQAFQIIVSSERSTATADLWDSGRIKSAASTHVPYAGKPLESSRIYYWKVRYWDSNGVASSYSRIARFTTGLFSPSDWKGKWITGANQLRKEFTLDAKPARALAHISGLGYYELRINGRKVGDHVLDPGWTTYDKRVLYVTYDVTHYLQAGANAIAVTLGRGWFGSRMLLLQLNIELEGGNRLEVVSDTTWKVHPGPIVSDSIYDGETYDARLETSGWDRPGFQDQDWKWASVANAPGGVLSAQLMPPIRVNDTIVPLKLTVPRPGVYVYDMGQNFAGWVRLRVKGSRGTKVRIRHAELVYDDGMLNTENLRAAKATDVYILRGDGEEEIYEPHFTYHGFRYVELTGYPGTPRLDTITGRVVHSSVRPSGNFAASKPILNQIQRLVFWGIRSNLHSVPTDCDQRDERMGWMADAHLYSESAILNFDMAAFYTNFLRNIADIQGSDGSLTDTVPHKYGRRPADPAWGSAYPLILWYMYEYYGDRRLLEQHYTGIKAWADFLRRRAPDGIVDYSYYGDWVPIEKTPGSLVSTLYYYWSVDITRRVAEILGKNAEADQYKRLEESIQAAFHQKFYNPQTGTYANGSQTANLLPLYLDVAPKEVRGRLMSALVDNIVYTNNTHLTTGILGAKYILPLLTRERRADLAYELATQTTYPSWGYMVGNGATTLWELWQNKTGPSMNSHNHPMFGSIGAWFYNALAGINPDPRGPGFARIRMQPQMVRDLNWASGTVQTMYGAVTCSWNRDRDRFRIEVAIPLGAEVEVYVPAGERSIQESGKTVWADGKFQPGASGIMSAHKAGEAVVFTVGSGRYVFTAGE